MGSKIKIFFYLLITIVFISCSEKGDIDSYLSSEEKPKVSKVYWGLWKGIDINREIFISGDTEDLYDKDIEPVSENVIKIKGNYYLRADIANTKVNGKVDYTSPIKTSGFSDVGNVEVVLRRIKDNNDYDKSLQEKTKPDNNGNISVNVPGGSEYELEGNDNSGNKCKFKTYVSGKSVDIGKCILVQSSSHNFKTYLEIQPKYEDVALFGDYYTYSGRVIIENTGETAGTGLSVILSTSDININEFSYDKDGSIGFSLEPGKRKEIPIKISFKFLKNWEESIKINVIIKDVFGRQWEDYVIAKVYKRPINLYFNTRGTFNGYVVLPSRKIFSIYNKNIRVPFLPDETIWFFFANPQGQDVRYSIGIGKEALDLDNYTPDDISSYEKNNTENTATILQYGKSIRSFLHSSSEDKDIDIYKYQMKESDLNKILEPVYISLYEYKLTEPNQTTTDCTTKIYPKEVYIDSNGTKVCVIGNGDGTLQSGEYAFIQVAYENKGVSDAYGVYYELTSNSPYITVYKLYNSNGDELTRQIDISPNQILDDYGRQKGGYSYLENNPYYVIKVNSGYTAPYNTSLNVKIKDKFGNIWNGTIPITLY